MAKVSNDISDLKKLLGSSDSLPAGHQKEASVSAVPTKSRRESDADILHSYIRGVLNGSEVYDMMKDTAIDGVSFSALADACQDELSKDIVEYFACCFFEGEYSLLDTLAVQCENGNRKEPSSNASVLGHVIPMTYQQEYNLIAELFSIALMLDNRMDDEQEEIQFIYKPDHNNAKPHETGKDNFEKPVIAYSTRDSELDKALASSKDKKPKAKPVVSCPKDTLQSEPATRKAAKKHQGIISSPSMKRRSFSSHVASSGVWGKIADYGGFNGRLIYINSGHGR